MAPIPFGAGKWKCPNTLAGAPAPAAAAEEREGSGRHGAAGRAPRL